MLDQNYAFFKILYYTQRRFYVENSSREKSQAEGEIQYIEKTQIQEKFDYIIKKLRRSIVFRPYRSSILPFYSISLTSNGIQVTQL